MRLCFPQRHHLRLQPPILRLNGIQPPLQHARLMTRVTQLRLQGFRGAALVGILPLRPACGLVELLLQLRGGTSLPVDFQQRRLLGRTQSLLRALSRFPLLRPDRAKTLPSPHEVRDRAQPAPH